MHCVDSFFLFFPYVELSSAVGGCVVWQSGGAVISDKPAEKHRQRLGFSVPFSARAESAPSHLIGTASYSTGLTEPPLARQGLRACHYSH